jgi:hypothetical protein
MCITRLSHTKKKKNKRNTTTHEEKSDEGRRRIDSFWQHRHPSLQNINTL